MKALIYLLPTEDDNDDIEFVLDFQNRPIPREGEVLSFEVRVNVRVVEVTHLIKRKPNPDEPNGEVWLKVALEPTYEKLTAQEVREILADFPAVLPSSAL